MKKICIIFCGGTITMKRDKNGALVPFYNVKDLLNFVPQLDQLAEISVIQLANIDSTNIEPKFWTILAETIKENIDKYDGFVITHGTDTMSYTASAISFALSDINKPIIFTGSQKPITDIPSDATSNLINAIIVASKFNTGVSIVFGPKILRANRTTKVSESTLDAFESPMVEPLGIISLEPLITSPYFQKKKKTVSFNLKFDPNIAVIVVTPGLSNNYLSHIITSDAHGLILKGFGPGNIPKTLLPFLKKAKDNNFPVVILSQCVKGTARMQLYKVGKDALKAGVIPGEDMTSEAASTKLMWILSQTRDIKKIKQLFLTNIVGEITTYGK
ncbi:MAG: asparaginase [Candidatus Roizmanbacteria bacterium]|nr:asparaginase [Candidatus Roizmanbacteria bacterium]